MKAQIIRKVLDEMDKAILATPTGEIRNTLTNARLVILALWEAPKSARTGKARL